MTADLARLRIQSESDVFSARQRIRDFADALGFDATDQVRIAIALSELGRVVVATAQTASVIVGLDETTPTTSLTFTLEVANGSGPALRADAADGLAAGARLMDEVVVSDERGLSVRMSKHLPAGHAPMSVSARTALRERLARRIVASPLDELQAQNVELLRTLEELKANQDQLVRVNQELEETNRGVMAMYTQLSDELDETNRGVVALYAELDERGVQLKAASTAKSRFLASVSHELRSPLNSVRALAELLREPDSDPLTAAQRNQVQLIETSANQLLGLVNDLLDLAKAESGTLHPELDLVRVGDVFAELRATLRPIAQDGVDLVFDVPDELPVVRTDAILLGQLVRNLVSNALKFTEVGEVRVRAAVDDTDVLTVTVEDTGVGIATEHQELIFEEFFQVPGRLQSRSKSTGLGLPYAARVAQALGGTLTVASRLGVGSTFTATVPVAHDDLPSDSPSDSAEPARPAHPATVLIADDDAVFRALLRDLLAGVAERILEAEDGPSALELLEQFRPDLALLDVRMPGGGGEAVLAALTARDELRRIPIVVVTSIGADDPVRRAIVQAGYTLLDKAELKRGTLLAAMGVVLPGTGQ